MSNIEVVRDLVFTRPEAAQCLGVSGPSLDEWRRRGVIKPAVIINGKTVIYAKKDVEDLRAKLADIHRWRHKPGPPRGTPKPKPKPKGVAA
jgi:hypothetical protein